MSSEKEALHNSDQIQNASNDTNKPSTSQSQVIYNSPRTTKPKKDSLAISIEEELARLEIDAINDFSNNSQKPEAQKQSSSVANVPAQPSQSNSERERQGEQAKSISSSFDNSQVNSQPVQNAREKKNQRNEASNWKPSVMDPPKTQVNGSVPVPPKERRSKKVPPELSIPGSVADTSVLKSELLVAVEQNKVDRVRRILKAGIDTNAVCDDKGRWPLHIAAFYGYAEIAKLLLEHGAQKDQPDTALERTPLLYAAATSAEIVKLLLSNKVDIHAVNKFGATALHYAAGSGQAECCRILATVGCDVNSRDKQKMTPLQMAARVDDIWSIEVLLEFGANVHAKDASGKTALHHAAETSEGMVSDQKKMGATFRRLIAAGVTVNALDNDGKTALYYAVQTGSPEACTILNELGADIMDGVSILVMSKKFPSLIRPFLDKCISSNIETCDPDSKHFYIQFDFTCLTFYPKDMSDEKLQMMQYREEPESVLQEMGVLHGLTRCKDSSILSHPICESLLRLKWKKVKWYLYLDMLLFAVFLAFLTAVIFMEYESDTKEAALLGNNVTDIGENGESLDSTTRVHLPHRSTYYCMDSTRNIIVWVILWILTSALAIREMIQLLQAPLNYVVQVENLLELALVFSVAMLSLAECGVQSFINTRDHFAAVCLIVGWTIQVTLYGKIPVFGVYIRMFAAVAVNILKCMFTYLGLLFAFSLTLHFLFRSQKEFDSVGFTFLKTFAMMIGEIELVRTFIENEGTYIVPFTSHLMFALFIIFISVILMCLLIALAVSDIASMQREGEYMQLVQQVKVTSQLEDALQHRALLFPQFGMRDVKSLHQRKGVIFPNLKDHGKLGKDALEIVVTQHTRKMDASNTNVISQQIHSNDNDAASNILYQTTKATSEVTEELLQKLKTRMNLHAAEMEKRNEKYYLELRSFSERAQGAMAQEIVLLKSQVDEMNSSLRELGMLVKSLYDRSSADSSSPVLRRSRHKASIDATTVTDFNATSPETEGTETSSHSSPERSPKEEGENVNNPEDSVQHTK